MRSALMRSHTPPSARSGEHRLHRWACAMSCSCGSPADDAVKKVGHVLEPRLDRLERLGEAIRHVVAFRDVNGGDVGMKDAVFENVNAAERPYRATHRARVVAGEDGRGRVEIDRRRVRLRYERFLQNTPKLPCENAPSRQRSLAEGGRVRVA